jgi:hypothetical protein
LIGGWSTPTSTASVPPLSLSPFPRPLK